MSAAPESPTVVPPAPAPAPERVAANPTPPAPHLSLFDFMAREPRLRQRPTLAGGFARHCERQRLMHATQPAFTAALDAFEHGAT